MTTTLTLHAFDPRQLGLFVSPTGDGALPMRGADVLAADPSALAVLDGPMFEKCPADHGTSYELYRCASLEYLGFDPDAGVSVPSRHPGEGATLSVFPNGGVVVLDGGQVAPGASVAVQGYPTLVRRGRNVASTTGTGGEVLWRAALVLFADGRVGFAVMEATMPGFANALIAQGVVEALYTDGGGSARIAKRGGSWAGSGENRRVGSWLVQRRLVQSAPAASGWRTLALSVAVGAGAWAGARWWKARHRDERSAPRPRTRH